MPVVFDYVCIFSTDGRSGVFHLTGGGLARRPLNKSRAADFV